MNYNQLKEELPVMNMASFIVLSVGELINNERLIWISAIGALVAYVLFLYNELCNSKKDDPDSQPISPITKKVWSIVNRTVFFCCFIALCYLWVTK